MVSIVSTLALSAALFAADLTGTWLFEVNTDAGSGTPTFVLKQEGEKLTGTYSGQLGDAPVTGTIKGNEVRIEFKVSGAGEESPVLYTGTVEGDNKIKGTVDLAGMAKGTFTGTKKK